MGFFFAQTLAYQQKQPAGGVPPGQDRQLDVPVPDYWYSVQMPGPGDIANYYQNPWFQGPYTDGYSPQSRLTPTVFYSGPPLDARAYDLPLTTGYDPNNPGNPGSC